MAFLLAGFAYVALVGTEPRVDIAALLLDRGGTA